MIFAFYQDSPRHVMGLKFALASLAANSGDVPVVAYCPGASDALLQWARKYPQVRVVTEKPAGATGWSSKPHVLLDLLALGHQHVVWLDADLIFTRDIRPLFETNGDQLVVTEDTRSASFQGTRYRTEGWGLPVGREYRRTINSCMIGVTPAHSELLRRWVELMASDAYASAQKTPLRDLHVHSDQEVLNALLGSEEFAKLELRFIRSGRDIIHGGSLSAYSPRERLEGLFHGLPPVIHASGAKPWEVLGHGRPGTMPSITGLALETSPYRTVARRYRGAVDEPCPWLDQTSVAGRVVNAMGFGHHALQGLTLSVGHRAIRLAANAMGIYPKWVKPPLRTSR